MIIFLIYFKLQKKQRAKKCEVLSAVPGINISIRGAKKEEKKNIVRKTVCCYIIRL